MSDPVLKAIKKYEHHPSILKIKENVKLGESFSFSKVCEEEISEIVKKLDPSKATTHKNIPIKIFKQHIDIYNKNVTNLINKMIEKSEFPDILKMADITPIHKKDERTSARNYRPVSVLPTLSKIFEKLLYRQTNCYIDQYLSEKTSGFREGFSAQHCLTVMIESMCKALNKGKIAAALLTDLSKPFDCILHDLLIAKMHAYGFNLGSLKLINSYLSNRKQRTKIDSSFSSWAEIILGVPQGSILGPLLFNIYINDIFFFIIESDIANYADDNTLYTSSRYCEETILKLEKDANILIKWFKDNGMKLNEEKCKLLILSKKSNNNTEIILGNETIKNSKSEKLLGITIDEKLTFNEHIGNLCKKASQKLHALARILKYMDKDKLRTIMKAFITSQFGYCPLVWMYHSRKLNNRINKIQERALRLVYNDNKSNLKELLEKDKSVTIHERNIQVLATEMYKIENSLSPEIMGTIFEKRHLQYSLRDQAAFKTSNINSTKYGTETISFRAPKIWGSVPQDIKNSKSLNEFKFKIKMWKPVGCNCRICKTYITNLGFI